MLKKEGKEIVQLGKLCPMNLFRLAMGNDGGKEYMVVPFKAKLGYVMVSPILMHKDDRWALWELPVITPVVCLA